MHVCILDVVDVVESIICSILCIFLVNRRHFTVMGINNMLLLFVQVTL